MEVINVQNLVKKFKQPKRQGELVAVNHISFAVQAGEVFGLLGPNGAGKTTTLEIIEGLQQPTGGETRIKGFCTQRELHKVKNLIGIQLQSSAYYEYLKLGEILELFGSFYEKAMPADKLLEIVSLQDKKDALIKQLSGGQQQRFSICAALVNDPEIVFLDEPTTGLDPQARRAMWEFIRKINEQGKTIVITTHYMEEAEYLCDRVGIMDMGKIVALDTPKNLIRKLRSSARIHFTANETFDIETLKQIDGVLEAEKNSNNRYHLKVTKSNEVLPQLYKWADQFRVFMMDLEVISADLEDVFLSLTGKKLRE
ncbi:MAG: ABC transporter ATP-binding protein [Patescibacteria group bacterium]|nr:ABC transporter ATP-binding protein [Patescibacteria group bacterium]MDD5716053.1 ABC transporter ATP-binding protein [Patescibacteria group bacterium]